MISGKSVICLSGGSNHVDTNGEGPRFIHMNESYSKAIANAGGIVVVGAEQSAEDLAELCDGLVLCGGPDIEPYRFGEEVLNSTVKTDPKRDVFEFALAKAFLAKKKPILTICRGFQLLNVELGGTLYQDIVQQLGFIHFNKELRHFVTAEDGSVLRSLLGEKFKVNSTHHQAIKTLGKGLKATAYSTEGIIEAYEHESLPIMGTQFHPERLTGDENDGRTPDFAPYFKHFISLTQK